jgi:DNA-binding CsgD family transcriptional regulator
MSGQREHECMAAGLRDVASIEAVIRTAALRGLPREQHAFVWSEIEPILGVILPGAAACVANGGHLPVGHRDLIRQSAARVRERGIPLSVMVRSVLAVLPAFQRFLTSGGRGLDAPTCFVLLQRYSIIVTDCLDAFTRGYLEVGLHHPVLDGPCLPGPAAELTGRECDILEQVALGHTNADIAEGLHVSTRTVANHLYRIYPRLGVQTRAGATHWWLARTDHGSGGPANTRDPQPPHVE